MRPGAVWLALDAGFCHDTDLVNLGEDYGAEGKLAVIALLCATKAQERLHDEPGLVCKKWRGFKRAACIDDLDRAKDIVAAIAQEGIIEVLESDEKGFTARILGWETWQRRARDAMRQQRYRNGHAVTECDTSVTERDGTSLQYKDSTGTVEKKDIMSEPAGPDANSAEARNDNPEYARLTLLLADLIEQNGSKRPNDGQVQGWRNDVRLMVEQDGRSIEQVEKAVKWSQGHEFWRTCILSMGKLREKYDQMRLQASQATASEPENRAAKVYDLRTACRDCGKQLAQAERSSGRCDPCFEAYSERVLGEDGAA